MCVNLLRFRSLRYYTLRYYMGLKSYNPNQFAQKLSIQRYLMVQFGFIFIYLLVSHKHADS